MSYQSRHCSGGPIEERAGFEHRVHRHRQFSGYGNRSAFEADSFPEFEAPCPQTIVGRAAGQDDRRCLAEKSPQMAIAASGSYVAVAIDLSRLVAPGRLSQAPTERAS